MSRAPSDYDYETDSDESTQLDSKDEEVVIAVMGATGSGKSSFINLLTGEDSVEIGSSLESETSEVTPISFQDTNTGRTVTLIDSPGFDDSRQGVSDTHILKKIASFLVKEYNANRKLNGLIFVQRISDPRFSGQSALNLKLFKNLCGKETYQNVIILTTFWDEVKPGVGQKREAQLKSQFFRELVEGGAHFMRNNLDEKSANNVLRHAFSLNPVVTKIQREIRDEKKTLEDTAAGSVHRQEIERLIAKHQKEVSDLKAEIGQLAESNRKERQELQTAQREMENKLEQWEAEKADLKKGLEKLEHQRYREQMADNRPSRNKHGSFRQMGLKLGKEIPFVPDIVGQPIAGGLGLFLDIAKAVRRKR